MSSISKPRWKAAVFHRIGHSHDKSMRLAMTCGDHVFACSNLAFAGDFTPVLAKHSKSFLLIDCISVGVDRNATQLRADAKAGRGVATERANGCHSEGGHLRSIGRGQTRSSTRYFANQFVQTLEKFTEGSLRLAVVCGRPSKPNFMSYSSDKARSMLAQRVISFRRVHFSIGFVKQLV